MKENSFVSIVAYVYNNEKSIKEFIIKMDDFFSEKFNSYEIILVDDNSQDNTAKEIFHVKDQILGNVVLVELGWHHGIELAMLAGGDISIGDHIYEIDSTIINYPLKTLLDLYKKSIDEGYDIVSGKPKGKNLLLKKFPSRFIHTKEGDLRIVTRRALNFVTGSKEKLRHRKVLYKYSGYESGEVEYNPIFENSKVKKGSLFRKGREAFTIMTNYSNIFVFTPFIISIVCLLSALFLGAFTIYNNGINGNNINTNVFLYILLLLGFSAVFFFFTVVVKYLKMLLWEYKDRKPYTVKSIKRLKRY